MAQTRITLGAAAQSLRVHPRTILRALSGKHNTYWFEDSDEDILEIADIAEAYNTSVYDLRPVLDGRDELLKPKEAAKGLNMQPRKFRRYDAKNRYKRLQSGNIVRYYRSSIFAAAIDLTVE